MHWTVGKKTNIVPTSVVRSEMAAREKMDRRHPKSDSSWMDLYFWISQGSPRFPPAFFLPIFFFVSSFFPPSFRFYRLWGIVFCSGAPARRARQWLHFDYVERSCQKCFSYFHHRSVCVFPTCLIFVSWALFVGWVVSVRLDFGRQSKEKKLGKAETPFHPLVHFVYLLGRGLACWVNYAFLYRILPGFQMGSVGGGFRCGRQSKRGSFLFIFFPSSMFPFHSCPRVWAAICIDIRYRVHVLSPYFRFFVPPWSRSGAIECDGARSCEPTLNLPSLGSVSIG